MVTRNRVIVALGVVILLLSVLADALGLGRVEGFGWKQTVGVLVGIVLIAVGYYLRGKAHHSHPAEPVNNSETVRSEFSGGAPPHGPPWSPR